MIESQINFSFKSVILFDFAALSRILQCKLLLAIKRPVPVCMFQHADLTNQNLSVLLFNQNLGVMLTNKNLILLSNQNLSVL